MLQLILGRAGAGKSTWIREQAAKRAAAGKQVILLVPEQVSFETEKQILQRLEGRYMERVEVLSFTRLCNLIFRTFGGLAGQYVDDASKNVLMNLAIEQVKDALQVYGRQAGRAAFAERMTRTIDELKNAAAGPEDALHLGAKLPEGALKRKTADIAMIYCAYDALLAGRYLDALDDLGRAAKLVEGTGFFAGYEIFIDAFGGFTAAQMQLLRCMLASGAPVTAAFCCDTLNDPYEGMGLFSNVIHTANRLKSLARECGAQVKKPVVLTGNRRAEKPVLAALEEQIMRERIVPAPVNDGGLRLLQARTSYEELELAACEIVRLTREEGLRYRDILLIARSPRIYEGMAAGIFARYGIPCYFDKRREIETLPLFALCSAVLAVAGGGWRTEALLRCMKTGLAGFSPEETALLENYAFTWNLDKRQWEQPFSLHPAGLAGKLDETAAQTLSRLEAIRVRLVQPFAALKTRAAEARTGADFCAALFAYLEETNVAENIRAACTAMRAQGESERTEEYLRSWELLCGSLDALAHLLENTQLTAARFAELFGLYISWVDIGTLPQTLDQAILADASLVRPGEPRAVFLLGADEGVFPAAPAPDGIFSEAERKILRECGANLADTGDQAEIDERFYAYAAATCASSFVYISTRQSDLSGRSYSPSALWRQADELLGHPEPLTLAALDPFSRVANEQSAFALFANVYHEDTPFTASLRAFLERYGSAGPLAALDAAALEKPARLRDPDVLQKLFGSRMRLSPSRLESFFRCPFLFFCSYVLQAKSRRKAELSPLESGSAIHFVLGEVLPALGREGLVPLDVLRAERLIEQALAHYLRETLGGVQGKPARFSYLYKRLQNTLMNLVKHLSLEFAESEFFPAAFEAPIRHGGAFSPLVVHTPLGGTVLVEGIVDRIDTYEKDGQKYVRVVDYKSGARQFRLSDVLGGLNMQMLLYLFAICKSGEDAYQGALPAGVLYMPAKNTIATVERGANEAAVEAAHCKKLRMNGLILDDPAVIRAMEKNAQGVFIPAKLKKDGSPDNYSSVASLAQLGILQRHVEDMVGEMAAQLADGRIPASPVKEDAFSICDNCDYRAVCKTEGDDNCRILERHKNETVFRLLEEEASRDGE